MQLAEMAEHGLRPQVQHTGATGVVPVGSIGRDVDSVGWNAERGEQGKRITFGVEGIDRTRHIEPVARATLATTHGTRCHALAFRRVVSVDRPDLEHPETIEPACPIAGHGGKQIGQRTWTHIG